MKGLFWLLPKTERFFSWGSFALTDGRIHSSLFPFYPCYHSNTALTSTPKIFM